ncbi:hypothetical protein TRFO_10263 [Tritrichomonas foetus]|uniref:Uncharacterized protein n=1 Tax=Tritrichomonas foetus TaxID=1144522 RepID=A0A1J4J9J6_9EUKA|nr:hypothetical protein TRFO_10263 [Tritrichomonas foetus]|eukprot:OHS95862.1 hypothetical protein TRFO_10263 [Tritrichomonas foetus]
MKRGPNSTCVEVHELLKTPINPSKQSFWKDLKQAVLISKNIQTLDRRSILNLKLIFSEISGNIQHLSTLSSLLRLLRSSLKADIGCEIGSTISNVVFRTSNANINEVTEFINTISYIVTNNIHLKKSIMDEIIDPFTENLASGFEFASPVLSAIFELMITLISQCPENRNMISKYLKEVHFTRCLNLIKESKDSLAQMLIAEWLWRSSNILGDCLNKVKIFGGLLESFKQIDLSNFRSSLHDFVMTANKKFRLPITHIQYNSFLYNNERIESNGWIDINPDTIVVWITGKSNKRSNAQLPDVVVFRTSLVFNGKVADKMLQFHTKENMTAFHKISNKKSSEFTFSVPFITKSEIDTFLKKIRENKPKVAIRHIKNNKNIKENNYQGNPTKGNNKYNKSRIIDGDDDLDETENGNSHNFDHFYNKKRVYANPKDKMVLEQDEAESKSANYFIEDDFYGKTTQEKEISMNQIEKILSDFQKNTEKSLNETEAQAKEELDIIISKLTDNIRVLKQMEQQHKDLTEATLFENKEIAENVAKLNKDFLSKHNETAQRKGKIVEKLNNDIENLKQGFIQDTNEAFTNNAIVGLSNNLANLRDIMCEIPA